jgi:hypothetical protein
VTTAPIRHSVQRDAVIQTAKTGVNLHVMKVVKGVKMIKKPIKPLKTAPFGVERNLRSGKGTARKRGEWQREMSKKGGSNRRVLGKIGNKTQKK